MVLVFFMMVYLPFVNLALESLPEVAEENDITKTALIIVGDVVAPGEYDRSKLYDAAFTTGFRKGTDADE